MRAHIPALRTALPRAAFAIIEDGDGAAPEFEIIPNGLVVNAAASILFVVRDLQSGVDPGSISVQVGGLPVVGLSVLPYYPSSTAISFQANPALQDGEYAINFSVKDSAGNEATANPSITYDNTAPTFASFSPTSPNNNPFPLIAVSYADNFTGILTSYVQLSINGQPYPLSSEAGAEGFEQQAYLASGDGLYNVRVDIYDGAFNQATCSVVDHARHDAAGCFRPAAHQLCLERDADYFGHVFGCRK